MENIGSAYCAGRGNPIRRFLPFTSLALLTGFFLLSGCAHRAQDEARIATPQPRPPVEEDAASETPPNVTELLHEAELELQKANEAHDKGEFDAAFEHYQRMLKLLLEADLDPSLFYESSEQFQQILQFYRKHAHLYHNPDRRLGSSATGVYSDIEIPFPLPQPVKDEIAELQQSYPDTFQRGLNRSSRYLPYIQEEFRKAGLPEDLAWLAMAESMFQPKIVSHAGAGGMWQFMRATGRRYNLRMDSYVDERYNWHSATRAATDYLKALHDYFDGDWSLAVTAYNMGEGGLSRAISANGGQRDFWSLINTPPASERIKQESKKYFPRLLAYIVVANAPEEYGFAPKPEPYEDVKRVPVNGCYRLSDLDQALGLPTGTLISLNPDLVQESTPPQGEYPVAVPSAKSEQFLAALKTVKTVQVAQSVKSSISGGATHRVRRGETVAQIASRYGVSEKELMKANRLRSAKSLQANQTLHIPGVTQAKGGAETQVASAESGDKKKSEAASQAKKSSGRQASYTVKAGDTLSGIARTYKVSLTDLRSLNSLKSDDCIRIGQVLKVGVGAEAAADTLAARYHEVKPGEYPSVIAKLYGMTTAQLLEMNDLTTRSVIQVGDRLAVSGDGPSAPGNPGKMASESKSSKKQAAKDSGEKPVTHKVAAGETASSIATRYGVKTADLLAANDLTAKSVLRVGQSLTVRKSSGGSVQRDHSEDIQVSQAQSKKVVHKVTAGQNPSSIARRYGVTVNDLFKWNNWTDAHVLKVGDEVSIFKD